MGEVYRATDLTLGQSVALKFLPHEAAANQALLERFHGEVRVARQVSHPNVCRVYDIGEVDGMPYLSMEYIDGEDLASLLRRIGRLPADKALEAARKICAGLAAAHDRGVIHRDLKPQNIMMNKRGEVLIMDFGLAALAGSLTGIEARNGTPAYMAPEQLKGAEVTARSDIYALGLVLYEIFTGKRPFEAGSLQELIEKQESLELTSMSTLAADVEPAVERVVRRCLDPDPAKRPASALSVSAALPGGDPLAAALAAGETPSPELVASSGKVDGLALRYSIPCLVLAFACVVGSFFLREQSLQLAAPALELSPEVLAQRARDTAAEFGYTRRPADQFRDLFSHSTLLEWLRKQPEKKWREWMTVEAPYGLDYRESPEPLNASPFGTVDLENPAPIKPGMVTAEVDGHGRLLRFQALPYGDGAITPVPPETIFKALRFDLTKFQEMTPTFTPRYASDVTRAWKGQHPVIANAPVSVQVAWWKGQVTEVAVETPWRPLKAPPEQQSMAEKVRGFVSLALSGLGILFAILFARRNWKLGRTDRQGAFKLAIFKVVTVALIWFGTVHGVASQDMAGYLWSAAGDWLFSGAFIWLLYLALEPALRARWPHSIVTWNRVLAGRWSDPQVGAHVLIGATVGCLMWASAVSAEILVNPAPGVVSPGRLGIALGTRTWIASYASQVSNALNVGIFGFFAIFGMRTALKKDWLAALAASVLFTLMEAQVIGASDWFFRGALYLTIYGGLIFTLLRLGLLATMVTIFFINNMSALLIGWDWKVWFAPAGLASFALLSGILIWAFRNSLGSQSLVGRNEA
jgi:hypothetical protein